MNDIKQCIKSRPSLNITQLEDEAGMPYRTLAHFLDGRRPIPDKHLTNLIEVLSDYGYDPSAEMLS